MGAPDQPQGRARESRLRRLILPAWVVALSAAIVAPMLAPGFVLSYDLVFTPRQDLLPGALGLGGGLPRAVPQDAVVAIAESIVPGALLEKAILLAIPLIAGFGMLRLLRGAPASARALAATLAIWNPFVAERLVIGHWGLLLAYALLPWALASAVDVRRGVPGAGLRLILQIALAGLTPTGGLLATLVALPVAIGPGSASPWRRRAGLCAGSLATWMPWLLPALLHPAAGDPAGAVFGLRDEGWGPVLTALGLGGVWNGEVVPTSRSWVTAPLLALVVVAVAAYGARPLVRLLGRGATTWWSVCAIAGVVAALASAVLPGPWQSLLSAVPGAGLARDAQKALAPLALLLAAAAGVGTARLLARLSDRTTRLTAAAGAALVVVALQPDIAWGVGGRLSPVAYPAAWQQARDVLEADARPGDVLVLPWSAFRRFIWNADRTVLDPAPRWLPRTTVVADGLAVATPDGIVTVQGDDPRAAEIDAALRDGVPLAPVLLRLGIGWVLVEEGQLGPGGSAQPPLSGQPGASGLLEGYPEVPLGPGLRLYAVPGEPQVRAPAAGAALVIGADLAVLGLLAGSAGAAVVGAVRRRRPSPTAAKPLIR